jgi:hypothetical protein
MEMVSSVSPLLSVLCCILQFGCADDKAPIDQRIIGTWDSGLIGGTARPCEDKYTFKGDGTFQIYDMVTLPSSGSTITSEGTADGTFTAHDGTLVVQYESTGAGPQTRSGSYAFPDSQTLELDFSFTMCGAQSFTRQ